MNIKNCLIIASVFLSPNIIWADDGEVLPFYYDLGGTLMSVETTDIQLESETIDVYLHDFMMWYEPFEKEFDKAGTYDVEVNYNFLNTSNARDVMLGFPTANYASWHVFNYEAYVDGIQMPTELKPCLWGGTNTVHSYIGSHDYSYTYGCDAAEVCTGKFRGHGITKVKNTFSNYYEGEFPGQLGYAGHYILHTGASWKDSINEVVFRLHTELLSEYSRHLYDVDNMIVCYDNIHAEYKDGIYTIVLKNIEPKSDFYFEAREKKGQKYNASNYELVNNCPVFVSSTLKPSGGNNYEFYNLGDEDVTTAWVEGIPGNGEGSRIIYDTRLMAGEGCDPSGIDSITFVNGYAKSDATYKNNSRVKDLEIRFLTEGGDTPKYETFIITLEDTSIPQTFHFERQLAYWVTMTIKSVYPGLKYKDTALSEIKIHISDD